MSDVSLIALETHLWPPKIDGRTFQQVLVGSKPYEDGAAFYQPRTVKFLKRVKLAAYRVWLKALDRRGKSERWGDLSPADLHILDKMMFTFMDWKSGRLECTYLQIREETGRATDTIAGAFRRLERLGILERMRRFRKFVDPDGVIHVEQANNAYRINLPEKLLQLAGLADRPGSRAADELCRVAERDAHVARMEADAREAAKRDQEAASPAIARAQARADRLVAERDKGDSS